VAATDALLQWSKRWRKERMEVRKKLRYELREEGNSIGGGKVNLYERKDTKNLQIKMNKKRKTNRIV
jgi:hypothetical protein